MKQVPYLTAHHTAKHSYSQSYVRRTHTLMLMYCMAIGALTPSPSPSDLSDPNSTIQFTVVAECLTQKHSFTPPSLSPRRFPAHYLASRVVI